MKLAIFVHPWKPGNSIAGFMYEKMGLCLQRLFDATIIRDWSKVGDSEYDIVIAPRFYWPSPEQEVFESRLHGKHRGTMFCYYNSNYQKFVPRSESQWLVYLANVCSHVLFNSGEVNVFAPDFKDLSPHRDVIFWPSTVFSGSMRDGIRDTDYKFPAFTLNARGSEAKEYSRKTMMRNWRVPFASVLYGLWWDKELDILPKNVLYMGPAMDTTPFEKHPFMIELSHSTTFEYTKRYPEARHFSDRVALCASFGCVLYSNDPGIPRQFKSARPLDLLVREGPRREHWNREHFLEDHETWGEDRWAFEVVQRVVDVWEGWVASGRPDCVPLQARQYK